MSLFNIGFVIFPDLTQLDFTGPLQVLSPLPQSATHIVAKSEAPVPSDCGQWPDQHLSTRRRFGESAH